MSHVTASTPVGLVEEAYARLAANVETGRRRLGRPPALDRLRVVTPE